MTTLCSKIGMLGLLLLMLSSCKYCKPGSIGEIPEMNPDIHNGGYNGDFLMGVFDPIPHTLECDSTYVFTSTGHDFPVGCQMYDYSLLYAEVFRHVLERMRDLRCPDDCPQKNPHIIYQIGKCDGDQAFVQVKTAVRCIKDGDAVNDGLDERTDAELGRPFKDSLNMPMPPNDETFLSRITPNVNSEDCPYTYTFKITFGEKVSSCDDVKTYLPYIVKVRKKASEIHAATVCGPNCRKQDLRMLGMNWNCDQGTVIIQYAMEVPCTP